MAKYFLGRKLDKIFIPIYLENIGTSIKNVLDYTTSFPSEEELREELLRQKKIQYYDDELAYVKEEGAKGNRYYVPILLGTNMCTIESKSFFNVDSLTQYCESNYGNAEFYKSLMIHYMNKLKIIDILTDKIIALGENRYQLQRFLELCLTFSSETNQIAKRIIANYGIMTKEEIQSSLNTIAYYIAINSEELIRIYYYFKNELKLNYVKAIEESGHIYNLIKSKTRYTEELSNQDRATIIKGIRTLLNILIYRGGYRDDRKEGQTYDERGLIDLGLFVSSYNQYERAKYEFIERHIESELDYDSEDFLEEEDFKRMHTTSTREGFYLRKRDCDKK